MPTQLEIQRDMENLRRADNYRLAVEGWRNDQFHQYEMGGPPHPFPPPPPKCEIQIVDGVPSLVDSTDRIKGFACKPMVDWGVDSTSIQTGIPKITRTTPATKLPTGPTVMRR